jgi:hypothetical protein
MASEFDERVQIEGLPKLSTNSGPVAWQWLDTAHFRKAVPAGAEAGAWRPLYAHPAPSAEPCPHIRSSAEGTHWCALAEKPAPSAEPVVTDDMRYRAARSLADRSADVCNVDREDNWKVYGDQFLADADAALRAALGERE